MANLPGAFAIDVTEVTRAQYAHWLQSNPDVDGQIDVCSFNADFTPGCSWPPAEALCDHPVVCVDHCDARAYCAAVGKRLCGEIGGGPMVWATASDKSQWFTACTATSTHSYPYGNSYLGQYCNGVDYPTNAPIAVGTLLDCQSSVPEYAGVFDLSGNVTELVDSCSGELGPTDDCQVFGGSFGDGEFFLACGMVNWVARDQQDPHVGFRCCAEF